MKPRISSVITCGILLLTLLGQRAVWRPCRRHRARPEQMSLHPRTPEMWTP